MAKNSLLRDLNFVSVIIHESKIKRSPPRFLTSREPHQCHSLVSQKQFGSFTKGDESLTKVDLSMPKVPNQAPKWLGTYGKYLYPKLATYLNKSDKILRADEYLLQQYCSAYDVYRKSYDEIIKHGVQQAIYKTSLSPVDGTVVSKDFQGYKKNPAYQMMSDSLSKLNAIGRELGLSPKARSEMLDLKAPTSKKKSAKESLKEFFG